MKRKSEENYFLEDTRSFLNCEVSVHEILDGIKIKGQALPSKKGITVSIFGIRYGREIPLIPQFAINRLSPVDILQTKITPSIDGEDMVIKISLGPIKRTFRAEGAASLLREIKKPDPFQSPVKIPKWKFRVWKWQSKNRLLKAILTKIFKV